MPGKVIIIGSVSPSCLEGSYSRAFQALGWTVVIWDPMCARRTAARFGKAGLLFSSFVYVEAWQRKSNLQILETCRSFSPDIVLVIGTSGVRAGTLGQIKVLCPATRLYCLYPDSPHNLDSERIQCLPVFDRIAVSSPPWVATFEKLGGRAVNYLPFAADPSIHWPEASVCIGANHRSDVTFLGNWRSERETLLEGLSDFDLRIWGGDYWKKRTKSNSALRHRWAGRPAMGLEFRQVCAGSKIMLNIMDAATWPGPNMRAFEQPACGAFSLVERTAPASEIFKEGETVECFDSLDEARDKIRFYLGHESARFQIAKAARDFVIQRGHTYRDRVQTILRW